MRGIGVVYMRDLPIACLRRAHQTIKDSPVVLWFPVLFSLTLGVFYVVLFMALMSPYLPGFSEVDALLFSQEMIGAALGSVLVLLVVGVIASLVSMTGTLGLQARAVRGESVETGDFFLAVRRFLLPVAGGQTVTMLAYALPVIVLVSMFLTGPYLAQFDGQPLTEADFFNVMERMMPAFVLAMVFVTAVSVFFSMWPKLLALGPLPLGRSLVDGLRFVVRNFWNVLFILGAGWLATLLSRMLLEGSAFGSLLNLALAFFIRSYVSLALMHLYLIVSPQS
jgi:hypothetical protein